MQVKSGFSPKVANLAEAAVTRAGDITLAPGNGQRNPAHTFQWPIGGSIYVMIDEDSGTTYMSISRGPN
jgi:hypothetical protein